MPLDQDLSPRKGSNWIAPDCAGMDFYAADHGLRDLLALYLPAETRAVLDPALRPPRQARRRPPRRTRPPRRPPSPRPARPRSFRPRRGLDRIPPRLSRDGSDRVQRLPVPRHEPPRRRLGHGPPAAHGRQIRLPIPVRAGRVRPDVPDQRHRHLDPSDPQFRQSGAEGLPAAPHAVARHGDPVEGHAVHDREGRRLRCRRHRNDRAQHRRHMAALRRQMVLLPHRRRRRTDAGPPRRRAFRHARPGAVRPAAPPAQRSPQRLSHRAAEGQARHPLDGSRARSRSTAPKPGWSDVSMPA